MNKTTRPTILLTACIRAISVDNNVCCSCIICISGNGEPVSYILSCCD